MQAGSDLEARNSFRSHAVALGFEPRALLGRCGAADRVQAWARNLDSITALHLAAARGHLQVVRLLVDAGEDPEARNPQNLAAPQHLESTNGPLEATQALIEAGADPDSRLLAGDTPLHAAEANGHVWRPLGCFLRAKADASLTKKGRRHEYTPLDCVAPRGRLKVVRELLQQRGIEGCGGESAGVRALTAAARGQRHDIMAALLRAGVANTGTILCVAAGEGNEKFVKSFLQPLAVLFTARSRLCGCSMTPGRTKPQPYGLQDPRTERWISPELLWSLRSAVSAKKKRSGKKPQKSSWTD